MAGLDRTPLKTKWFFIMPDGTEIPFGDVKNVNSVDLLKIEVIANDNIDELNFTFNLADCKNKPRMEII